MQSQGGPADSTQAALKVRVESGFLALRGQWVTSAQPQDTLAQMFGIILPGWTISRYYPRPSDGISREAHR